MEYLFVGKKNSKANNAAPQPNGLLEQRTSERKRVRLWVTEERKNAGPKAGRGAGKPSCIVDLSARGAFVTGMPARLDSEIELEFVLPSRLIPVQAKGRVVRAVVTKDSPLDPEISRPEILPSGMGIEFTQVSHVDREALEGFLTAGAPAKDPEDASSEAPTAEPSAAEKLFADSDIELFLANHLGRRS